MNESSEQSETEALENARQTQRWARRYAQHRSLPVVVGLVVFALLFLGIALPSYWGGVAYREGNMVLLAICIPIVVVALAATLYFSIPPWGGRRLEQLGRFLYAREGEVTLAAPVAHRKKWGALLGAAFGICVAGSVVLGLLGYLPDGKYQQPISALYCVPFLVGLHFLMRPMVGHIALLWPFLYALHAILIVAGAPIVFTGTLESLNMLIPVVGYGILTGLVGHTYSRWALYRLRTLSASRQGSSEDGT